MRCCTSEWVRGLPLLLTKGAGDETEVTACAGGATRLGDDDNDESAKNVRGEDGEATARLEGNLLSPR